MAAAVESHLFLPTRNIAGDDFDNISIHSTAPSYISDAPSYHSVAPHPEAIPPYTPPGTTTTSHSTSMIQPSGSSMIPDRAHSSTPRQQTIGLPPIPSPGSATPQLNQFRIPSWSIVNANPTYHNVARRRAQSDADPVSSMRRAMLLERVAEDEDSTSSASASSPSSTNTSRTSSTPRATTPTQTQAHAPPPVPRRPLEDPHLVGEAAAAQARRQRLARERGNDILREEDRQWNWFLAQMGDWEERDRSWTRFRREVESGQRRKLTRRLAGRLF